ncbi:MAG: polyprenyl synthetase family protein [Bacillota bacterium]
MDVQIKNRVYQSVSDFVPGALTTEEKAMIHKCLQSISIVDSHKELLVHCLIPTVYLMRSHGFHQRSIKLLASSVLQGDYYSSLFYRYMTRHHPLGTLKVLLNALHASYVANTQEQHEPASAFYYFQLIWQQTTDRNHRTSPPKGMRSLLFDETLDTYKQQVQSEMLSRFLTFNNEQNNALRALITSGGKQTRLTLFYHALSKNQVKHSDAVAIGLAIEGIHLASLIHDDIIDGADMRRHQQTLHESFSPLIALHMGNVVFTQSLLALADIEDREVHDVFSRLFYQMVGGEIKQQFNRHNSSVSLYRHLKVIRDKTALFVESILYVAGYLSGNNLDTLRHFRRSGYCIGMAYQLKDDLFDYLSAEETLGKPVLSDQKNGYYTLVNAKDGIAESRRLAHRYIERALCHLRKLPPEINQRELIYYTTTLYKRTR